MKGWIKKRYNILGQGVDRLHILNSCVCMPQFYSNVFKNFKFPKILLFFLLFTVWQPGQSEICVLEYGPT